MSKYSWPVHRIGATVDGNGPAVVLLHSSMSSKSQWRDLIERMRHSHKLIAIDLYGYGDTPMPSDNSHRLADEVQLVESVLASELHEGERFHLVGHSYGAIVALQIAQRRPRHPYSLSLFEPVAFHLLPTDSAVRAELESVGRDVEAWLTDNQPERATARFIDYWSGPGTFARMAELRQAALTRCLPKAVLDFKALGREAPRIHAYSRIKAPTCLIAGRRGPRAARRLVALLAAMLSNVQRHEVTAGHMAPVTHPELVNPIVERFIRSIDATFGVEPSRPHAIARRVSTNGFGPTADQCA